MKPDWLFLAALAVSFSVTVACDLYADDAPQDESPPPVTLINEDTNAGYALHWGGPKPPYSRAEPVQLTLAADEYESLELGVLSLADIGEVTCSLEADPPLPPSAVRIRTLDRISNILMDDSGFGESVGLFYDYKTQKDWAQWALLDRDTLSLPKGAHKSFWITFNTRKIKPGRYAINIHLRPTGAPHRTVHVDLDVLDVRRADDSQLRFPLIMRMYHTLARLNPDGLDAHFELLSEHYIRQLMMYFNSSFWADAVRVELADDGSLVTDFAGLESRVRGAIPHGIDTVALMYHLYNKQWVQPFDDLPEEKRTDLRIELAGRVVDCLYDLGFKDVWMYTMDEPKVDYAVSKPVLDEFEEFRRVHPRLKFQISFNDYAPEMINTLDPYIDIWTANSRALSVFQEDKQQGRITIDPSDQVGFYRGTYYIENPDLARSHGWFAAMWRCDHYTLFAYHQGFRFPDRQWVCFAKDPAGRPVSTPGLDGMREGFEDFTYWRTLDHLIAQADALPKDRLTDADTDQLNQSRNLRDQMFAHTAGALVHLGTERRSHPGGRPWPRIRNPNRWNYAKGKATLLEHIAAVERIVYADAHQGRQKE